MTTIIALETSSAACSVALAHDETRLEDTRELRRSHNDHLLPMLDGLLQQAGIAPRAVDVVAFGAGPGSFTGVRLAAATAQALAVAAGALVVPVASSAALAARALATPALSGAAGAGAVATCIHSRGDAFYLALYQAAGEGVVAAIDDALWSEPPPWIDPDRMSLAGLVPHWLADWPETQYLREATPTAGALLDFALQAFADGSAVDAAWGLPRYLEGDSPWRTAAERLSS
jgi:tRNA threonylcarbamoyladenosine biosynthesis protein TsaB